MLCTLEDMRMLPKEIVRRCIRHQNPVRLGFDFLDPDFRDIRYVACPPLKPPADGKFSDWGNHASLSKASGFHGETRLDTWGNVYGRLGGRTKGECVLGALQNGWEALSDYTFPVIDERNDWYDHDAHTTGHYLLCGLPTGVFSTLRDVRRIDNALMDVLEEPEMVSEFVGRVTDLTIRLIQLLAGRADGVMMADDWGTQSAPLINPEAFQRLFMPHYKRIADTCHALDIDFMLHSCGYVLPLVHHMLDAGIDVLQFDQPELVGSSVWADQFGRRAAFYMPVDIQKILPTGDRRLIEETALSMATRFKACGGSLIAKDYPSLDDINVHPDWAKWARDIIVENAWL